MLLFIKWQNISIYSVEALGENGSIGRQECSCDIKEELVIEIHHIADIYYILQNIML